MTSKSPLRSCEDADERSLSYAEIKALCSGNPLMREKMDLDVDVAKLRFLKAEYTKTLYGIEDTLKKKLPQDIQHSESRIKNLEKDIVMVNLTKTDEFSSMKVLGRNYAGKDEKAHAGAALIEICKDADKKNLRDGREIGEYRGFKMSVSFNFMSKEYDLTLHGNNMLHTVSLGESATGNITRIDNVLAGIAQRLDDEKTKLSNMRKQVEDYKVEITKPFPREREFEEKSARLNDLNILLSLDKRESEGDEIGEEQESKIEEPQIVCESFSDDIEILVVPPEVEEAEIPDTFRSKISVISVGGRD